jgi:UPF0755 protein
MARRRSHPLVPILVVGLGLSAFASWQWLRSGLAPLPKGEERYVRFASSTSLDEALARLQNGKIIRDARRLIVYAWLRRKGTRVASGTYRLGPGMTADQVLNALSNPVRQMVRIPETNFSYRTARLLERYEVCRAQEYLDIVHNPANWPEIDGFAKPPGSLEGYLYPDTYELPPLLGAKGVVERQLSNFARRILPLLPEGKDLHRLLTVASMVELEVKLDRERPIVAGVIENRIRKGMRLQIDATVNYALKEWRPLSLRDLRIDHPYNTYRYAGLPPGPICSPSLKSFQSALSPAKHNYLYYVALPDGSHLFSETYEEHVRNIGKRKAALAAQSATTR